MHSKRKIILRIKDAHVNESCGGIVVVEKWGMLRGIID